MATYRITVIPGDGIGPKVMAEALKVLRAIETHFPGLRFDCKEYRAGARCYTRSCKTTRGTCDASQGERINIGVHPSA